MLSLTQTETAAPSGGTASQIRIVLKTKSREIELPPELRVPVLVSTELRRYQLSTFVNRQLKTDKPIPFEFLINGQFLRTSLDEFLTENGISAETTLNIDYVKALIPPVFTASYEHDDWVSSVDVLSNRLLSGSYDRLLRVWNLSSEIVATGEAHTAAVKSVRFVSPTKIVSSSDDRTVRVWKYQNAEVGRGSLTPTLELYGHKASVTSLSVHAASARILSASSDHSVGLWSSKSADAPEAPQSLLPTANKRRKLSSASTSVARRGPLSLLAGHQQQVGDVTFDANDSTVAYSASWDHAIKTWDLTTSRCVDTRTTDRSLFAVSHFHERSLIATGGALGHISLVDPRATATTVSAMTLRGHRSAVTAFARDPDADYQFVSASRDGTCRIWDIRSARTEASSGEKMGQSVFVIERESGKGKPRPEQGDEPRVLSVCWDREVGIVSGGKDKMMQINKGGAS